MVFARKHVGSNVSWLFASEIITNVLGFITIVLIARFLGDTELGKYTFAFAFANLFILLSDMGLQYVIVLRLSKDKKNAMEIFNNALSMKLVFLGITMVLTWTWLWLFGEDRSVIVGASLAIVAVGLLELGSLYRKALQAYENMKYEAVVKAGEKTLMLMLAIVFITLGGKYVSIVVATLFSYLAGALSFIVIVLKNLFPTIPRWDKSFVVSIGKEAWPWWLTGIFAMIFFRVDVLMLTWLTNYQVVGLYSAAYKIIEGLNFVPTVIVSGVFPTISRLFVEKKEKISDLYHKASKYLLLFALPIVVGGAILSKSIINFVYGTAYAESAQAFAILVWVVLFIFMNSMNGHLLGAIGKQRIFLYSTIFSAIVNVVLNYVFIKNYGMVGAAVATVIAQGIHFFILRFWIKKNNLKPMLTAVFLKGLLAVAVMGGIVWILPFAFAWKLAVGFVVYIGLAGLFGIVSTEEFRYYFRKS